MLAGVGVFFGVREVAVDFVCADVVKAESFGFGRVGFLQAFPVGTGGFQQGVGADDVGFHEGGGAVYGAVYVAFGGQVHDDVWLVLGQGVIHGFGVADVGLDEGVAGVVGYGFQGFEVAGVGEFVDVDYGVVGVVDEFADYGGADEAGAAGD